MIAKDSRVITHTIQSATTTVIGIGNEFRGDDGLGLRVAREIASRKLHGVRVAEAESDGASLMRIWEGVDRVLLVDAMKLGFPPGTVHRIDASRNRIPIKFFTYSSHAFGVGQAIEMARELHQLPPSLIIYGMEGDQFDFGTELSLPLERNIHVLNGMIVSELNNWMEQ